MKHHNQTKRYKTKTLNLEEPSTYLKIELQRENLQEKTPVIPSRLPVQHLCMTIKLINQQNRNVFENQSSENLSCLG